MGIVPQHTLEALDRYVEHGLEPGSFLMSVLCNDLFGAVYRADSTNLEHLRDICIHIHWEIPSDCWGNENKVRAYMKKVRSEPLTN